MDKIIYTEVTEELMNNLIIHPNLETFSRYTAYFNNISFQPATDKCFRLFYVNNGGSWEVHAIELDILFYLAKNYTKFPEPFPTPTPEPTPTPSPISKYGSKFYWDRYYGLYPEGRKLIIDTEETPNGHHLYITGDIQYYSAEDSPLGEEGNIIGTVIELQCESLDRYPDATFTDWSTGLTKRVDELLSDEQCIYQPIKIMGLGDEYRLTIQWNDTETESFIIIINRDSKLISKSVSATCTS